MTTKEAYNAARACSIGRVFMEFDNTTKKHPKSLFPGLCGIHIKPCGLHFYTENAHLYPAVIGIFLGIVERIR